MFLLTIHKIERSFQFIKITHIFNLTFYISVMADEFIDILDKYGNLTNEVRLKSEAHHLGLYHASVHIWFYASCCLNLLEKKIKIFLFQ